MTEENPSKENEELEQSVLAETADREDRLKAALEAVAMMEFIMRARPMGRTPLMW